MIERLTGKVVSFTEKTITVDVSGVGYQVTCPRPERFTSHEQTTVLTELIWNQEKGPQLYGFADDFERMVFQMLINCSKIGPGISIQILGQLPASECVRAIGRGDSRALSSLHGIGAKKAAQIITDMQDKCTALVASGTLPGGDDSSSSYTSEVAQALESLGYSKQEIARALQHTSELEVQHDSFDKLLRACLSILAKKS